MTAFLSIALLLALAQILRQRSVARRRYGQLICEHKRELTLASMRGKMDGVAAERARQETQEAA